MLSTAETLLGLTRHLSAYTLGPNHPRPPRPACRFAGQVLEMGVRLRGSGVSPGPHVLAIALDVGIPKRHLISEVLPALEALNWVECQWTEDHVLAAVSESLPPLNALLASAGAILDLVVPEPMERAVVTILDTTTVMPITRATAIQVGAETGGEEAAARALDALSALHLVQVVQAADGKTVVYNPNIWASDADFSNAALRAEDSTVRAAIGGLLEEIAESPGLPQRAVQSAERKWIDYAVSQGLVQRSLVITSDGKEQAFLFTPHMSRSAF